MSNRGCTFLTDPCFSQRPSYRLGEPAALGVSELPALGGMLISHHHYDHCGRKAVRAYRDRGAPMLVAAPVAARARRHGFTKRHAAGPMAHSAHEAERIRPQGGNRWSSTPPRPPS